MPIAEYLCELCDMQDGSVRDVVLEIYVRGALPKVGSRRRCPASRTGKSMVRILSSPSIIIRGETHYNWKQGETAVMRHGNRDIRMQFIDHKHTDPNAQRDLGKAFGMSTNGGLSRARVDEKSGRLVVDVASNIPDPLGALEKGKRSGDYVVEKKQVNTPVKRRTTPRKAA